MGKKFKSRKDKSSQAFRESSYKPSKKERGFSRYRRDVIDYFTSHANVCVSVGEICKTVGAEDGSEKQMVSEVLDQLMREKLIQAGAASDEYIYRTKNTKLVGSFRRKAGKGHNFFFPEDGSDPIRVAERNSAHAFDGDKVMVQLLALRPGQEIEGEVIEILERVVTNFVGVMSISHGYNFLITDSRKLDNDILIPDRNLNGAQDGEKVLVHVLEWPDHAKNPVGEVISRLGEPGSNDTEMHAILAEYGLPYSYPEKLEQYANDLDEQMAYDPKYKREDYRDRLTFTCDPESAKDYDDALSYKDLGDGTYEVGVHIADVTSYVTPGDPIDEEASQRATSVYLVDRTVPMLPERLCNDLCSLRAGVDRPAFSCIFRMNPLGTVLDYHVARTMIHSDYRFKYEEVLEVINGQPGVTPEVEEAVHRLDEIAKALRKKRFEHGSIEFEQEELVFDLDEKGKPISVHVKENTDANRLIEDYMLLANRTVAKHIAKLAKERDEKIPPFIYRVHDRPDEERLQNFAEYVGRLGYKFVYTGDAQSISDNLNKLLEEIKGKPEENVIQILAIRTMSKAVYQTENIGHFGLGFEFYTHFTSPIRRHPDMMVHRLLWQYMTTGKSADRSDLDAICEHDSEMEKTAADAERSSVKYKQIEYMQERLGQEFEGMVSGVKDFGIFVEIKENGCEGLVPIRDLSDDFYEYDDKTMALVGINTRRRYALGDTIKIRVARADLQKRFLDFELADKPAGQPEDDHRRGGYDSHRGGGRGGYRSGRRH